MQATSPMSTNGRRPSTQNCDLLFPAQIRNLACDELGIAESTYYRTIYPVIKTLIQPRGIGTSLRSAPKSIVTEFIYQVKWFGLSKAVKQMDRLDEKVLSEVTR